MKFTDTHGVRSLHAKPAQYVYLRIAYTFLIVLFIGSAFPARSYAQSNDPITNQTIIQLSKAGIGKQIILAKIDNSVCNFDLSTDGLIALKKNGVPDDIVASMISKANNANQAPADQSSNAPDQNAQSGGQQTPQANDGINSQAGGDQSAQADANVSANTAPPELPTYEQPPCPVDGYLWVPGYWAFNLRNGFFWVPGVWVAPPNPGLLWTPAYWGYSGGIYVFHRGYWGHSVGFYGGINYGYGYGGVGFVGGGWYGSVYRYNTAVVRVNTVVIHNTYVDRTVVHENTVVNRTSFNGRGGVEARPRPEEVAAMKEQHFRPTSEQLSHQQLASNDKNQFARVNNGRPAQAALPRVNTEAIRNQRTDNLNRSNNGQANSPNRQSGNGNPATDNTQKGTNRAVKKQRMQAPRGGQKRDNSKQEKKKD